MARRSERLRNKTNLTENTNTLNRNKNNIEDNTTLELNENEVDKEKENTQKTNKKLEVEQILKKTVNMQKLYLQISKEENEHEEKNLKMRCIICYGFYNNPIMCKKCEEIFCEGCIFNSKLHGNNNRDSLFTFLNNEIKCPHCRSDFEEKKIQKQYLEILNKKKIN